MNWRLLVSPQLLLEMHMTGVNAHGSMTQGTELNARSLTTSHATCWTQLQRGL